MIWGKSVVFCVVLYDKNSLKDIESTAGKIKQNIYLLFTEKLNT
jgi:hypothetical protein